MTENVLERMERIDGQRKISDFIVKQKLVCTWKSVRIDLICSKSETQKSGSIGCITAVQKIKQAKDTAGQGCLIISMLTTKKKTVDSTAMLSTVQGYNMKSINIIISLIL